MLSMLILCTGGHLSSSISFENLAVHRDNFSCMPDNVVIFKKKNVLKILLLFAVTSMRGTEKGIL